MDPLRDKTIGSAETTDVWAGWTEAVEETTDPDQSKWIWVGTLSFTKRRQEPLLTFTCFCQAG